MIRLSFRKPRMLYEWMCQNYVYDLAIILWILTLQTEELINLKPHPLPLTGSLC
jgi:hypothetical protein